MKTANNISSSNNSKENNDPNYNLPVLEILNETLFSQGYDRNGLMVEYMNKNYKMHKCKNYNAIKIGCNGTAEIVVSIDVVVDSLCVKLKKRGLRRDALKAGLLKRLKQTMVEKTPLQINQQSEPENVNVFAAGAY